MNETSGEEDAVRAFEGLKSEVARLRRGSSSVVRESQEAAVDYSPKPLGEMAKTLAAVQSRLAAIEGKPRLLGRAGDWPPADRGGPARAGEQAGRAMMER